MEPGGVFLVSYYKTPLLQGVATAMDYADPPVTTVKDFDCQKLAFKGAPRILLMIVLVCVSMPKIFCHAHLLGEPHHFFVYPHAHRSCSLQTFNFWSRQAI